mmetsp:Transcript_10674/g.29827  ORF Transcript_10674/g.29827 Transcript_10674/m.29827 type:complete len:265 (+) Transcript_10674:9-803(+)
MKRKKCEFSLRIPSAACVVPCVSSTHLVPTLLLLLLLLRGHPHVPAHHAALVLRDVRRVSRRDAAGGGRAPRPVTAAAPAARGWNGTRGHRSARGARHGHRHRRRRRRAVRHASRGTTVVRSLHRRVLRSRRVLSLRRRPRRVHPVRASHRVRRVPAVGHPVRGSHGARGAHVTPRAAARPHPREPHSRRAHHLPVQRLDRSLRVGSLRKLDKPAALTGGYLHVHQLPERLEVRPQVGFRECGIQAADEDGAVLGLRVRRRLVG